MALTEILIIAVIALIFLVPDGSRLRDESAQFARRMRGADPISVLLLGIAAARILLYAFVVMRA